MVKETDISLGEWPSLGRMGRCHRSSPEYRGNEEGRIALVVVDQAPGVPKYFWEVYMDIEDNFPSSISFGDDEFKRWIREVEFEWIEQSVEEEILERELFGLRDYWKKQARKANRKWRWKWRSNGR